MTELDPTGPYPSVAPQPAAAAYPYPVASYGPPGYVPPGYGAPGFMTDQQELSPTAVVLAWVSTVLTAGYMLPWAIAASRGRANQGLIGVLTLLTAWTFVGWVVTLVMACMPHRRYPVGPAVNVMFAQQLVHPPAPAPIPAPAPAPAIVAAGWYPSPHGGQEYWDGERWTGHRAP